jgi:hypothetical protein
MTSYSKREFGQALLSEMAKGFDVVRLSRWAFAVRLEHEREFEEGLDDIVMSIVAMEEGPEFEYSEVELRDLAQGLCSAAD